MGSKYSCFGRAASTAIILDRAWKGKRVKSGLDSKVVISLIENAMREGDPNIASWSVHAVSRFSVATHGHTGDKVPG